MSRKTYVTLALVGCLAIGCTPSGANIKLRKENEQMRTQVAQLQRERQGDVARIDALLHATTRPTTMPQVEMDRLYTAHGLSFGSLTGGYKDNDQAAHDAGVAVYVVPTDQETQTLKAAGSFIVTLFDLSVPEKPLVGKHSYSLAEAKANWYGQALLFDYVLKVPFQTRPNGQQILVRVEFTDELTGRKIVAEKNVQVIP